MEENPIEGFFAVNLQNEEKSLIRCCYNVVLIETSLSNYIAALSGSLDLFTTKNECVLFLDDFKVEMKD